MDMNEKFKKALELQDQGVDRRKIYKLLEYQSIDALTKMMKKFGYWYDKNQRKYIKRTEVGQKPFAQKENVTSLHSEKRKPIKEQMITSENSSIIDLKNDVLKGNILGLANHYDEIMGLLTWYKAYGGQVSSKESQVIEVVQQGIKIDLPRCESTKTSIRVNKEIWEQFGKFAELHNEFSKGDLLAQALKEYMKKHE